MRSFKQDVLFHPSNETVYSIYMSFGQEAGYLYSVPGFLEDWDLSIAEVDAEGTRLANILSAQGPAAQLVPNKTPYIANQQSDKIINRPYIPPATSPGMQLGNRQTTKLPNRTATIRRKVQTEEFRNAVKTGATVACAIVNFAHAANGGGGGA